MDEITPTYVGSSPVSSQLTPGWALEISATEANEQERLGDEVAMLSEILKHRMSAEPEPTYAERDPPNDEPNTAPLEIPVRHTDDLGGDQDVMEVLHIGCGDYSPEKLPTVFRAVGWREVRLDIDPEVRPDIIASVTDMSLISDNKFDAVYSSHNIEHLYPHDVSLALGEIRRVLKPTGFALIVLPDLQEVACHIAEGKLEDLLYMSPVGPIAPLDILFGYRPALAAGNLFMAHHTGFTAHTLGSALTSAGFVAVMVQRISSGFFLTAVAFLTIPNTQQMMRAQALIFVPDHPAVLYTIAAVNSRTP